MIGSVQPELAVRLSSAMWCTRTSFYTENMLFDSDDMAEYFKSLKQSAPMSAHIRFRLDAHKFHFEISRCEKRMAQSEAYQGATCLKVCEA